MVSFEIPSRLSLCFQNEIGLSFRKLKSYEYHLHDYVKFDRNRINLYPYSVTRNCNLNTRHPMSKFERKTNFFYLTVKVITITKSSQKNKLDNQIVQL